MMAYNERQKAYDLEYAKKHKKRIPLDVQKSYYEKTLKPAADRAGEPVNTYIKNAINERIERERVAKEDGMKKWYAVQETREDAWDYGSHDYDEAVRMLREQGHGLIAVIDEDASYCLEEIEYDNV